MSEARDEERQVAEFSRQTRKRRIFFAVTAFGVACLAIVGGALLFGGQLQTAQKARAGQAVDELRRRFDAHRPRCPGLWRAVYTIDWSRIPENRSRPMAARLAVSDLSCDEVSDLARGLPRKAGVVLPAPAPASSAPAPASGPVRIRVGPGIRFGPPGSAPAVAPAAAPAP